MGSKVSTSPAHTAGKWTAEKRANWIIRSAEKQIATVSFTDSEEEHEANASLIAAAPELLEALRLVAAKLQLSYEAGRSPVFTMKDCERIADCILKAEGRA